MIGTKRMGHVKGIVFEHEISFKYRIFRPFLSSIKQLKERPSVVINQFCLAFICFYRIMSTKYKGESDCKVSLTSSS